MTIPKIDTFEQDIADEIKNKEASVGDIASVAGSVGNYPNKSAHSTLLIIAVSVLLICGIIAIVVFWYIQYSSKNNINTKKEQSSQIENKELENKSFPLKNFSSVIDTDIGEFLTDVKHTEHGYSMTINSYSPVFSYMLRNENKYSQSVALAFFTQDEMGTSTEPFKFTDVTINNQNMRVGTSGSSTIVYSFINTNTLLFSSSTEGILSLRSAILH